MIANWRRPGMASRKSSRRLPASSGDVIDRPVTLPPGRARLATRPVLRGSATVANTIGMTEVAFFAAKTGGPDVTMTSTFSRTNSAATSRKTLGAPFRPTNLKRDGAALDPPEFAQSLHKSRDQLAHGR